MNAAALMTADQYRAEAQKMIDSSEKALPSPQMRANLLLTAQVYALLAISAQAQENANAELPF